MNAANETVGPVLKTGLPVDSFSASCGRFVNGWNRFWFNPADPTTLAIIRIGVGLVVLYVHLAYCFDLQGFFGRDAWYNLAQANEVRQEMPWIAPPAEWNKEMALAPLPDNPVERERTLQYMERWGVDSRLAAAQGSTIWSVWFHVTDPATMACVHVGILVVMTFFTLGLFTRVTSVLTWLGALSYIHRSPQTLFGMDTMMNIALLYLMIGSSGAALSLDRLLWRPIPNRLPRGWRGTLADFLMDRPEGSVSTNIALRMMQIHFCIIYLAAGLSKLLGGAWWSGTALWWTLANYEFTPLRYPLYAAWLRSICAHRWLWELIMTGGVLYTLALEIGFPFLVWDRRWRWLMMAGAVGLHTGIAMTMGLIGFGLLMLALVFSFMPAEPVRELLDGFARRLGSRRIAAAEQAVRQAA